MLNTPTGDTPRILEVLAAAWNYGEAVEFSYLKPGDSRPKHSVGDVVFMEINHNNWYIFLKRRGEEQVKTFHLSRFIDAVRRENDPSLPIQFNPRRELDGAWGIIGGAEHCEIILRFVPEAVPYVEGRRWPGQVNATMDGKYLCLTIRAPTNHQRLPIEVLAWIHGWGPRVEVLSPHWIRTLWLTEAQELLTRYQTETL